MRYKRPDQKNAASIFEAAQREMQYTMTLPVNLAAGPTIIRNIYEAFRMLGDALLIAEGKKADDHIAAMQALTHVQVQTSRPVSLIDNLRRLRHNINYYGYIPSLPEIDDTVSLAKTVFVPLLKAIRKLKHF